jgi:hypothetical protein
VATPGALQALDEHNVDGTSLLSRHMNGDWGEVDKEDWATNNEAVKNGQRIVSSYPLSKKTSIWVITEWDRSVTTLLLPDEY